MSGRGTENLRFNEGVLCQEYKFGCKEEGNNTKKVVPKVTYGAEMRGLSKEERKASETDGNSHAISHGDPP